MWLNEWRQMWLGNASSRRTAHARSKRRKPVRLLVRNLEQRLTPTSFKAPDVTSLIADINTANGNGMTNTISLTSPSGLYDLMAINNSTDGNTGLPQITSPFLLTIVGNNSTIERSTATGTPAFRLFDVAGGAALKLENLTLADGLAYGAGAAADGGAIYNQGTLTLSGVRLTNNTAQGSNVTATGGAGQNAAGGAIWTSGGSLTLTGGTWLQHDNAEGGNGGPGGQGGDAMGGGIYADLTKLSIGAGSIFDTCWANGGWGGAGAVGGAGCGGGLAATGSATATVSVSLTSATFQRNRVRGGFGGSGLSLGGNGAKGGDANGGALYLNLAATKLVADTIQDNEALAASGGTGASGSVNMNAGNGGNGGDARGGGLYVSGGSLSEANSLLLQDNTIAGGSGGNGGFGRRGGNGGDGGNGSGGGLYSLNATLTLNTAVTVSNNFAHGGNSGSGMSASASGTAAGNSGNGGNANGGGIYATASTTIKVSLQNALVQQNQVVGGFGFGAANGVGGVHGGNGGNTGEVFGAGLFLAQNAALKSDTFQGNLAQADFGGAGSARSGGHAGQGGSATGGALYVQMGVVTMSYCTISGNSAVGSAGGLVRGDTSTPGLAGAGGAGVGGGVAIAGGTVTVSNCHVESNTAHGGNGGADYNAAWTALTGTPAFQGAGGAGYGGGLYISGGTLKLVLDDAENNQADAGVSAVGKGTLSTAASGGGLYKAGGVMTLDTFTKVNIINNTDSNNDAQNNIGP